MKKIFIIAGEQSGEMHAAFLMDKIKEKLPNVQFFGIGGKQMEQRGLKSLVPLEDFSVVGFFEVAKKITFFKNILNKCKNILQNGDFDVFIPVDFPGFNIRLAKFAKSMGIPVIYYIAPQLWAWGKNRAKELSESLDKLLVVFPFEVEFFNQYGIDCEFVGHPLLDRIKPNEEKERLKKIAFLPGSRMQEIHSHLPLLENISYELKKRLPDYRITLAKSPLINQDFFNQIAKRNPDWEFAENSIELMKESQFGVIKTGTSNLEAALCGLPFIMFYKTSFISYFLGKKLINLDFISLVNILSKKKVISEYIQKDINPKIMVTEIVEILNNQDKYIYIQNEFSKIRKMLGESSASEKAAEIIVKY
ncbi:MAG TPA: lipid-A-disaccharide synthase [Candidatus Kapabacteria bacterium]|nr:lipid-A-disaccharide synthase [Candidatus Kapabacteria bacterium]HPO62801.1 lipid-A-disaccharide synthase [Candidatus Kapabacteria bacterium]